MRSERYILNLVDEQAKKYAPPAKYSGWERNVRDEYKNLTDEQIKAAVEANRLPFAILMTHINIDYNLAGVLRVGNCFGAKVFYYGVRKFDRRAAVGCYKYSPITHLSGLSEVEDLKKEYEFVGLEQTKASSPLYQFKWQKKSLIIIGEETRGLEGTPEIYNLVDRFVEIPQRGSIRSLNATTAASIACYDYSSKWPN